MNDNIFHVGLCMGGSVSAGAYTAGVMDYLIEALQKWQDAKSSNDKTIPQHDVIIDLLCGTSGGGITSAISLFALQDAAFEHCRLNDDGRTYKIGRNNILWQTWVELTAKDFFPELLKGGDIKEGYIPSALNVGFVDGLTNNFNKYVTELAVKGFKRPPFISSQTELFMTLFNVTGINYVMKSKDGIIGSQYISEHRDIGHFRWNDTYENDGRIELLKSNGELNLDNLATMFSAAKATSAFPVGLKARYMLRKAKHIWDNPFFNKSDVNGKGGFDQGSIILGKNKDGKGIIDREDEYLTINSDGGVADTKPVEIGQDIMLAMRNRVYSDNIINKESLNNSSIILIDPFPTLDNDINAPVGKADNLIKYLADLVGAMRSQLLFDSKDALEAYRKDNYGLHVIAPSKDKLTNQQYAIACGSIGGFGGFLNYEFRVHDFFLGRHNCQSFLRKYFVVNVDEDTNSENYACAKAVIDAYKNNPEARARFEFTDKDNKKWAPIIPDVVLNKPDDVSNEVGALPEYNLAKVPADYLEQYRDLIEDRLVDILKHIHKGSFFETLFVDLAIWKEKGQLTDFIIDLISKDLKKRGIMKKS